MRLKLRFQDASLCPLLHCFSNKLIRRNSDPPAHLTPLPLVGKPNCCTIDTIARNKNKTLTVVPLVPFLFAPNKKP